MLLAFDFAVQALDGETKQKKEQQFFLSCRKTFQQYRMISFTQAALFVLVIFDNNVFEVVTICGFFFFFFVPLRRRGNGDKASPGRVRENCFLRAAEAQDEASLRIGGIWIVSNGGFQVFLHVRLPRQIH